MTGPVSQSFPVIAIDGPGGAGKGTICRRLAKHLGWHYLDSGALYRLLGLLARRRGCSLDDGDALAVLVAQMQIEFGTGDDERVWLDGEDVSAFIRTETAGADASQVAAHAAVRDALMALQRNFCQAPGLVADGRDMGTVVFPEARLKIFLTASAEERADRRYKQLIAKGIDVKIGDLLADIRARDERDSQRAIAPLRPADDAFVLDTTSLNISQVLDIVIKRASDVVRGEG